MEDYYAYIINFKFDISFILTIEIALPYFCKSNN